MIESNQVMETILKRRSIRKFDGDKNVTDELVDRLLEAGRLAPSGLNNQPWRFAIVRRQDVKDEMAQLTHYHGIIRCAPVLIIVLLDTESLYHREKDIQAVGACIQNLLLAAHSRNLGAVWLGEILKNGPKVVEILQLSKRYELMAVVALGYPTPDYRPKPTSRKPLDELILYREEEHG
ncbi:MAG: nitroreductase family protein [Xanthomonadaceae bacterium]|nr:nitroreductase family protein [Xanthomonadaceae bacterium]